MAHGNNRTSQMQRFRQRFMHKLVYFPANNDGMYSCVGCGRCVEKCPSSLNIVKVIKAFEKEQAKLLGNADIRAAWLEYLSRFPHVSNWFRIAPQFKHQSALVNGKKTGSDINLYKLFTEQCHNLLREGGECGIVIPSGIYTDLGAKGLRDMLFDKTRVTGLFCFENNKEIFEGVHRSFKFVVMTFEKGGQTERFPAAFMRHEVMELKGFPGEIGLPLSVELIRRLSPDSHSVMEFKSELDIRIAEKMLRFPLLGEKIDGGWNLVLANEFHMTNDSRLFKNESGKKRLPLYEGKHFHQFDASFGQPKYWLDESEARSNLLSSRLKQAGKTFSEAGIGIELDAAMIRLDYESYRLAFRDVARNTDERTFIGTILPPNRFCPHTVSLEKVFFDAAKNDTPAYNCSYLDNRERLFLLAVLNGFVADYLFRQRVTAHISFFFVYNLPVPRLSAHDSAFAPIVTRAARLICTTPEFDELAKEVGLAPQPRVGAGHACETLATATPESRAWPAPPDAGAIFGVTDPAERARLRAELDGLIAHLYGLTEAEFTHILSTFPLVAEPVKIAALNAYRDVERGLIQ